MDRYQTSGDAFRPLRELLMEKAFGGAGRRRRSGPRQGEALTWSLLTDLCGDTAVLEWGARAPQIEEQWLKNLLTRSRTPPADGRSFRAVLAALDVPLFQALRLMRYWPDLLVSSDQTPAELLFDAALAFGMRISVTSDGPGVLMVRLL